jgi:hypothetical protein
VLSSSVIEMSCVRVRLFASDRQNVCLLEYSGCIEKGPNEFNVSNMSIPLLIEIDSVL